MKIYALKHAQKIEKGVPFKSLFALSRYLNRLPRYKDSNLLAFKTEARRSYEWARHLVTYIFFLETRTTFFQESRLPLVCTLV